MCFNMIKKVKIQEAYSCFCGDIFKTEDECLKHAKHCKSKCYSCTHYNSEAWEYDCNFGGNHHYANNWCMGENFYPKKGN